MIQELRHRVDSFAERWAPGRVSHESTVKLAAELSIGCPRSVS